MDTDETHSMLDEALNVTRDFGKLGRAASRPCMVRGK
jgi:hypothetical protein